MFTSLFTYVQSILPNHGLKTQGIMKFLFELDGLLLGIYEVRACLGKEFLRSAVALQQLCALLLKVGHEGGEKLEFFLSAWSTLARSSAISLVPVASCAI